jgi:hypothetical protein
MMRKGRGATWSLVEQAKSKEGNEFFRDDEEDIKEEDVDGNMKGSQEQQQQQGQTSCATASQSP